MPGTNDFLSKPLIAVRDGKNCGIVTNMLFTDDMTAVTDILVFDQIESAYNIMPVDKIINMNGDAVTTDTADNLSPYDGRVFNPVNFDVFDVKGRHLGIVSEILFTKNYRVKSIVCRGESISPARLISHSDDTLVVKERAARKKQPEPAGAERSSAAKTDGRPTAMITGSFLVGRRCDKNILNRFNEIIVRQGGAITPETVREAKLSGKLLELSMHAVK